MTKARRVTKLEAVRRQQLEAVWLPLYQAAFDRLDPDDLSGLEWAGWPEGAAEAAGRTFNRWAQAHGFPTGDGAQEAQGEWVWGLGRGRRPTPPPAGTQAHCERIVRACREMAARPDCPAVPLVRFVLAHYLVAGQIAQTLSRGQA